MDFPFSHRRVLYIGPMDWCGSSLNRVFFWSVLFFVFFGPALWLCVSLANEAVATALEIDRFFFLVVNFCHSFRDRSDLIGVAR